MNSYELYKKKLDELYGKSNKVETNEKTISSKDLSWWEQFGAGFERIRNNIVQGALDLGEGIIDTGAGALAFGASVFGNPVMEKEIEKFIKTDYTKSIMESDFGDFMGNVTGDWLFGKKAKELAISQERFLPEVMGVSLDDIATGVGNALGTAGLALIPGVGQMAVFGAFSGTGIEEALNQGATINEAMAYGALSGATEMITEKVMGDVLGLAGLGLNKAFGVGASKALTKGGASAVKNIFKGMTEEGLEEVVSELVNPIWQMLTYKSETEGNFLEKYSKIFEENGGMKGVIESFIAGGLTGGVFEGVGTAKGITRYGSLQNYNLELETQQLYEINRNLENALAEGDEKKYQKYQNQKQAVISRSLTKFENLLNQLQSESNGGNEKRLENKRKLANAFADESLSKPELELAKKILGKNVDVEITGSKDSETQVQKAIVKLSKGQISVKDYVKTILHEGGHLVDAGKGKFVETILNGMSDETYKEMWETLEPKYKKEIMQSNMLKREMNNNPGLTAEEAYERIKKKYLDEEIAVEYFGTMFKNSKEFMNDIKAYTSKGLKALKEKFRLFFRGKAKPDNYKELLEMFDKGIKEADERAVKRLEAERKKEREKRIKEIEESLPTDEEDVKYRKSKQKKYATIPSGTEEKFFYKLRQRLIDNDSDKRHIFTANYLYLLDGNYLPIKIIDLNNLNLDTNLLRKVLNDEINEPRNTDLWFEILQNRERIDNSNIKTSKQRKESGVDVGLDGGESPNKRKRDSSTSSEDLRDDTRKRITKDSDDDLTAPILLDDDIDFDLSEDELLEIEDLLEDLGIDSIELLMAERRQSRIDEYYRKKERAKAEYDRLNPEQKRNLSFEKSYDRNYEKLVKVLNLKMSKEAKEYFKDTKLRTSVDPFTKNDGTNYLIPMFHGTPNSDMYFFDSERIGENGTLRGHGFYLTDVYNYAKGYSGETGKVIMSFVNIKKPLSDTKKTLPKNELKTFIRKVVDPTGDDWLSNYGDVYSEGYEKVLNNALEKVYEYNSSDSDIIEEIFVDSRMEYKDFYPKLTELLGYDGVIFWNRSEGTIALAFNSNQIKDISNANPTEDEDIRYRRTENQEEYYEDLLNEDAELAKVVKRLESILEKYEDAETPVPRSKKALEYLEKLRSKNEILIGYYEDLVDDLNNAIESKNKAEFTKVLAELKVLTETIQNLQNQVDDWVYNVDTTGEYDNEVPASAESGFDDRIATADEISDEIYDSFSDVEIDLEEYDEEFIKTTFPAEPVAQDTKNYQLKRIKSYSTADGYQAMVDRINNATKDEIKQISNEVTAFVNKNKPKTAEEIAQEKLRDKITEARNLISEVEPLIESVNYTSENSGVTIQDVKDKGKAIIKSLEASIDMSMEERIDNNLERLNKFKELVSKFIKEDTQQETKVVEKPVEPKVVEEPTKPVDKANIEELAKPIHKKYRYIESVKNLKDSLKHADGIRKLSTANEKKALIKNEIKNIKELLGKEYVKELMDIGMSEQEARNYAKDRILFFLEGEGDYKGLQSYLDEINEQIKHIEQFTPAGDENIEKAITPKQNKTKVEIKEVVKVVRDSRTNVRKQPTPSAQTVNLYADFVTDPDARVYAQKRGVELLQVLVDELDKGLIGKNNKPRLFFKNGREFVINKIHMILNKFSNAQYTKGGEDFFDYSNLTTEEQIDLIVKEVMTGVQLLTKVYEIDETTGNPISDGEMQYVYIGVYNPHYQKLVKFLTTQLENIIENEGSIPKAVELIDNATEGFKKEIENANKLISDYEAQTLAYSTAVQELRREIELLNKALVESQNDKEPNLKAIEKLQEQLASKNETLLKIKEKLEGRITKLSEDRKALKGLLTETLANTRSLEKEVEKAQKTISKLKTKLETKTREAKELKELADNTARKVKKLQQLETKYGNQVIVKMSQLERGRELPNDMNNVLTEVGRLINPEFEINSKLSIEIAKLLLKKEYHEAFNLMINAVYDSNFEVEDGFVDYHELVDMFNVDETNEFLASMNEMEQWFNEFVATGKVTKVEKLYRKIERITNAYQVIKDKYNEKRAEMAVYRASRNAVGTTQRINRRLKKLKSEKRFGGLTEYQGLVDWLFESYDKIKGLKLKEIQNGDYRAIADEILNAYNKIKNDLPLDLQMDEQIYIQAQNFITGGINGKNVKAYVKFLNQLNRYAKDITGQALYTIDGVSKTRREWATEIYDNLNDTVGSGKVKWNGLLNYALDPRVVFKALSGMDESKPVYKLYKMLNEAEINYQRIMIDLGQNIRDFYKNNKKFMKELRSKKTVNIGGYTATRSQFLSLYKLIQREQAKAHLINSSGGINLNGEIIRGWTEEKIEQLENDIKQFFDLDNENSVYKQYIDLTTEFFDNAKKLKVSTDMELMGYTNVEEGEYFPIQITEEDLYSNLDKHNFQYRGIMGALDMSFNKDVSSSSKAMKVGDIDDIMNRHMRQMATYSAYAIPIHTFNKIYNYRFSLSGEESKGALNGVNSLMRNKAEGFEKFINNLFMDIQGINPNRTADGNVISKAFGWARGNFAKFQLGANLKVIFTQVSALGNALKYIKLKNIIRGVGSRLHIDSGKYALPTVGVYRNMTNTISTAQMQKENQGSFWTQGIEWADQKCIRAIWRACLLQTGMDVEKATEMFNKTVQETQPNYTPLQRSAMMRSKNEVMKALTMFGNQPSKNFSNIVEAVMTISYKKKNGIKITGEDMNFVRKTVFESVLWSSAIYSIMSVIFSHLTNNDWDDEPEEYASELFERLVNDAVIGNIPLVGNTIDIDFEKGFVWNEFDMSNSLGIVNDTVSALQDALNGNATPKQMIETIGKAFGIPTANVYKYVMTFVQWVAPQYATQVELMYKGIDLTTTQAVKNTQNHKTKNYYYAYTTNTVSLNQKTMDELYRLYQKDDNVILKAIPKSITFNGESMIIKRSDFKAYYNKMTPVLESVVSDYAYQKLTDEQKALVIKNLINKYHSMSKKQFTESDMNSLEYLMSSGYNNLSKDLIYLGQIKQLENKQEIQKFINKLPLKASQKYLLYYLSGYSINDNQKDMVMAYLKAKGVNPKQANTFFDI